MHLHPLATAKVRAPQAADGLHPTEGFFDPFTDPLAHLVTRMAYGAGVERRTTGPRQILRNVWRDVEGTAGIDEIAGVVALVADHRDAAPAGQARCDHRKRGTPLGISIGRLDLKVDQNGVAVLH